MKEIKIKTASLILIILMSVMTYLSISLFSLSKLQKISKIDVAINYKNNEGTSASKLMQTYSFSAGNINAVMDDIYFIEAGDLYRNNELLGIKTLDLDNTRRTRVYLENFWSYTAIEYYFGDLSKNICFRTEFSFYK